MPEINKIIHLVRDSYEWCLSNYLYHIQDPTPEEWFKSINSNINSWFNEKELRFMSNELDLDFIHIEKLINYIKTIYDCPPKKNYYQYLKSIPAEKAIIIETTRFLLNNNFSGGCDHFRMAINSKYLNYRSNNVLTLHMNDFREDKRKFTLETLFLFCFDDKISKNYLNDIISNFEKKTDSKKKGNHFTHNKFSEEYKNNLINCLRKNEEISFILNYINILTPKSNIYLK